MGALPKGIRYPLIGSIIPLCFLIIGGIGWSIAHFLGWYGLATVIILPLAYWALYVLGASMESDR